MFISALARRRSGVRIGALIFISLLALAGCDDAPSSGGSVDTGPADADTADATADQGPGPDQGEDCSPGTEDCRCLSTGACRLPNLSCSAGYCRDNTLPCDPEVERCPPAEPRCYTPCRADLVADDGSVRVCSAEGLINGCLPGATCVQGSCGPVARPNAQMADVGACANEAQCPDFQTCLRGRCYAECERNDDCSTLPGNRRECARKVCRETCGAELPCTDPGTFCDRGQCLPLVPADGESSVVPTGAFEVNAGRFTFTASTTEAALVITNVGSGPLSLTLRKVEQVAIGPDGAPERSTDLPLPWLTFDGQRIETYAVEVAEGDSTTVVLGGAGDNAFPRWTGRLELTGPDLPAQEIRLVYSTGLTGRWSGTAFVFGSFGGGAETDAWTADRTDDSPNIPNAFMQVWANYRNGGISQPEMAAILQATLTGAWDQPRVRALCSAAGFDEGSVCAPFNNAAGVIPYTTSFVRNPVPSGVLETDFSIEVVSTPCDGGACAVGRIDSEVALQYPGDPEVRLRFAGPPDACEREDAVQGCVTTLDGFDATSVIVGRYVRGCTAADANVFWTNITQPWLVKGFRPLGLGDQLEECRSTDAPRGTRSVANARFAEANPVPDGRGRRRRLELVDGLLVEQNIMTLILRETVDPFHGGGAPLVSYQFVMLTREPADPADLRPEGVAPPAGLGSLRPNTHICDDDLVREINGAIEVGAIPAGEIDAFARIVLTGSDAAPEPLPADLEVHSLCIWDEQVGSPVVVNQNNIDTFTGTSAVAEGMVRRAVIDAGPAGNRPCFPGGEIIYFAVPEGTDPAAWTCNQTYQAEDCLNELQTRAAAGTTTLRIEASAAGRFSEATGETRLDLLVRCRDGAATCNDDRFNLMNGKEFLVADGFNAFFAPLNQAVAEAFRYKTRFAARAGTSLGFSPTVCRGDVRPDPYCFDPAAIERVRARVDCLLQALPRLAEPAPVIAGLKAAFGALALDTDDPVLGQGFEDLYAELLIMRGDEALTAALSARYAVGSTNGEPFEGDRFEADGINLSGLAGVEMAQLHRAVQTYDLALNRFFGRVPYLWANAESANLDDRFVTDRTVAGWMERVIRASTQRARAVSEIARRYQTFNQPELALSVIRRGYVRAHQEGMVLSALINAIADKVAPERKDGVRRAVAQAQTRYRVALLEMADRNAKIASGTDAFGFTQGFVPFPALNEDSLNGFEEMLARAQERLELAAADETRAINERRTFDSDEAAFRAELITQRNTYEAALAALCGTFQGNDGRTWPAIERYRDKLPDDFEGDPCGRLANGALWLKAGDVQGAELDLTRVRQEAQNALDQMKDSLEEVRLRCALIDEDVSAYLTSQGVIDGIEGGIDGMEFTISILDKLYDFTTEASGRVNDVSDESNPYSAAAKIITNAAWGASAVVHLAATTSLEATILTSRAVIRRKEREYEARNIGRECDYLQLEAGYALRAQERDFLLTQIDALQTLWTLDVELAELRSMVNERNRLEAEWADAEQLAVDAAGAQADPTRRIFKNDAIRNAEQSFDVALRTAWQATLTYEYYAGITYPQREALFLARLVDRGDVNLRRYVEDLREAFFAFGQSFGNPDTRVARISLCDDIFAVPRLGPNGEIRSSEWRTQECRRRLKDPANLDPSGALRIPFSTDFRGLSPRTVNHKILFVEVGLQGDLGGDGVARVYLEATGTGVVTGTDGDRRFYTFPPRTAVLNPFFSGEDGRAFGQDADGSIAGPTRSIYRSYRFRERPVVQSGWSVVLDQRSEAVNRDIDLSAVNDIVLDIYYTDFTLDTP